MKGLILAGGKGTRLYPTTRAINKHILLIWDRPMVFYPIETLKEAGITDIIISLSHYQPEQFMKLLGDGKDLGVKLTYVIHGPPKGIAYAINHAHNVLGDEPFVCLLGDNIFGSSLKPYVEKFEVNPKKSLILLKEVGLEEAKNYGVAEFGVAKGKFPKGELKRLIEKPLFPPTPYIMLGAYFLNCRFFDAYSTLKPSERGEYEITDAINALLPDVRYEFYKGVWFDAGTFDSILEASQYMRGNPLLDVWRENIRRTLEDLKERR